MLVWMSLDHCCANILQNAWTFHCVGRMLRFVMREKLHPFGALTLSIRRQEGQWACKNPASKVLWGQPNLD